MTTHEILERAVCARQQLAVLQSADKDRALLAMADRLVEATENILSANQEDLEKYGGTMTVVMQDRLRLTVERIADMAKGIREVVELPDPVGAVLERVERPNGMVIEKTAVPMGVVAIIYESRPNVTSDAAALAFKSGNVCILRSGKEAWNSAKAITDALRKGLQDAGLPEDGVQLIEDTTRQSARELMEAVGYVDLLIPRGGPGLINACLEGAKVPVIQTGTGICHIYVDETADFEKALNIIENAKTSRPSVCNAAEVCIVHEKIAEEFLPRLKAKLSQVEFRCDPAAQGIMQATPAGAQDFDTEFLDYVMAVKTVADVKEAIAHIAAHSTGHSEAIITENEENARLFTAMVDSAAVYVNVSTRFTDGGQFGLGCEMGISTQKLHARGPMGLRELTTYKYVIRGNGQIRG